MLTSFCNRMHHEAGSKHLSDEVFLSFWMLSLEVSRSCATTSASISFGSCFDTLLPLTTLLLLVLRFILLIIELLNLTVYKVILSAFVFVSFSFAVLRLWLVEVVRVDSGKATFSNHIIVAFCLRLVFTLTFRKLIYSRISNSCTGNLRLVLVLKLDHFII